MCKIEKLSESEFNKLPFDAGDTVWVLDSIRESIDKFEIQSVSIYLREVTYHAKPIDIKSKRLLNFGLDAVNTQVFKDIADANAALEKFLEENK